MPYTRLALLSLLALVLAALLAVVAHTLGAPVDVEALAKALALVLAALVLASRRR